MKANYEDKTKVNGNMNMSLYDINKQVVVQLPTLTDEELEEKYELINEYGSFKEWCMMLSKEIGYYTVFHHIPKDAQETFASAVLDCCTNLGEVKAIDWADEDHQAIEIWIVKDNEAIVFYLFDYAQGVIECQM